MAKKKVASPQPVVVEQKEDPSPLLMKTLLSAKAELIEAGTDQAFLVVQDIMALEASLPAKTILAASAIQKAKALSLKAVANDTIHPEEVQEVLLAFSKF
jgi:hypothetical protein